MSLAAFQEAAARLVAQPGYATAVRDGAPLDGLSERERVRLVALARAPGLEAAVSVHVAWRLSKLLARLPLTRAALGDGLAERVHDYWAGHLPRALAFEREAIEFGAAVRDAADVPDAVREVAAFEVASLQLEEGDLDAAEIAFTHDPEALLAAAAGGAALDAVPRVRALVCGRRRPDGRCEWTVRAPSA